MIEELDVIILTVDMPKSQLKKGDMGTVVKVYGNNNYDVEFLTTSGNTIALLNLDATQVRSPYGNSEIIHVRDIA